MQPLIETEADRKIESCIEEARNFALVAGAGSGKTTSLVMALNLIRRKYGKSMRLRGQKVACITFTNVAVEIIKNRTELDELFAVSTIHSFLWRLIEDHQEDIRLVFFEELVPIRIAKKEEDSGGNSKKAIAARQAIVDLKMLKWEEIGEFRYDEGGSRDYSRGRLDHDDIIDLGSIMIKRFQSLQFVIASKYPYIFIDEAQDTFKSVLEAIGLVTNKEGLPIAGYFGDPMQQIYDDRAGVFFDEEQQVLIKKEENYRCSTEVIHLLNKFRPDLQQVPSGENTIGSVHLRLVKSERGSGDRASYTIDQLGTVLNKFDAAMDDFGWSQDANVKQLFLTRQMIAHRLGFSKLNRLFTGKYATRSAEDNFKSGEHFALQPFMTTLIPLMDAYALNDQIEMMRILRDNSPLLSLEGANGKRKISEIKLRVQSAIKRVHELWAKLSIREILAISAELEVISLSYRLAEHLQRSRRIEEYDEGIHMKEKGDWLMDEFFDFDTTELTTYRKFILNQTPFSTQHGVKGDEFSKVLVVFDDTEANWNNFSFTKLFTPNTVGKSGTPGQQTRSLNLAYVCFSRAEVDLKVILFTENPGQAKAELLSQGLFREDQISIQP